MTANAVELGVRAERPTGRDALTHAAAEVIALLREANARELSPAAAQRALAPVRKRWPELRIELLWQEEPFDHSFQFNILVREAGGGETLSVGLCVDRQLPWPLRGAQRWSEFALVGIDGRSVNANEAFGWLDLIWNDERAIRKIVETHLIHDELDVRAVEVDDEAVAKTLERVRRSRRLFTAVETHRWLEQQGLQYHDLELLARKVASHEALRLLVVKERGGTEAFFRQAPARWDRVLVVRLKLAAARHKDTIESALAKGPNRLELAATTVADGRASGFELVWRRRWMTEVGEVGQVVSVSEAGQVTLECAVRVEPAELDGATNEEVIVAMFDEWLDERRKGSKIEWYWGKARLVEGNKLAVTKPPRDGGVPALQVGG